MTGLISSDTHRAMLCRLSYDSARPLLISLGSESLPRVFLDQDQDGMPVITCEGTRPTFLGDWKADFDQEDFTIDPTIDPVPHGWGQCMVWVMYRLFAKFDDPTVRVGWNGHSMGAADALIGAAIWKLAGRPLGRVTAFEPGRVGRLGGILDDESVLITHVGEGISGDPVPGEAPWRVHPTPETMLPRQNGWTPIDCHEMMNVAAAVAAALETGGHK